jgi:hypothetical protein
MEGPPVTVGHGRLTGESLPPEHRHIDVTRIDVHPKQIRSMLSAAINVLPLPREGS